MNFKDETILHIANKAIVEYCFVYLDMGEVQIFCGEKQINWDEIPSKMLDYDEGYGLQCWDGFISFDDGSWCERFEYDGSEKWVYKKMPTTKEFLANLTRQNFGLKFKIL